MALGASPAHVVGAVFRQGLAWTAVGLTCGVALSLTVSRALDGMVYGITPTDAVTYAVVVTLLGSASLVACCLPARRAAHVAPTDALRDE